MSAWWIGLLARLVPARWRASVLQDVAEEAETRRGISGTLWIAGSLIAIGLRFRASALAGAFGTAARTRWTGFFRHECRQAVRRVFRTPAASLAVLITLSTTMGAAIATFSVVQSMVLAPLPFRDPGSLVAVWQAEASSPDTWLGTSLFNFVEWKKRVGTLDGLVAVRNTSLTLTDFDDGGTPLMQRVSHGYFELLGVEPVLGRTFTAEEDLAGGPPAVMLSEELWRQRFGADPRILGRTLTLDGRGYTIVGITPAGHENPVFGLVDRPQAFVPLQAPVSMMPDVAGNVLVIGRLTPGRSIEAVREEFSRVSLELQRESPATHRTIVASVQPLAERLVRDLRRPLFLLLAAVLGVVLAACGNVANLLLARAISTGSEMPVRKALGASPARVAMQRVVEALILAATSAAAGIALAVLLVRLLPYVVPQGVFLPKYAFSLDVSTFTVAAALALLGGLIAAGPSAAVAFRAQTADALRGGRSTLPPRERRWSVALVTLEVITAVVLLCGAALAGSGLRSLAATPPGFDPDRALTFRSSVRGERYQTAERRRTYFEGLAERVTELPGVEAVGIIDALPIYPGFGRQLTASAVERASGVEGVRLTTRTASAGVRQALGIELAEGRWFDRTNGPNGRPVTVVTESVPRLLGITGPVVGQSVRLASGSRIVIAEIIGVAREMRSATQPDRRVPLVYLPYEQDTSSNDLAFIVRSRADDPNLISAIRAQAALVERSAPIYMPRTLREIADTMNSSIRFVSILLMMFGGVALLLVAVGIYGTISCVVTARQAEFGVRRAVGASTGSLLMLVFRDAMRPAAAGVGIGLCVAVGFGRVLASYVRGTPGPDAVAYAAVAVLLLTTAAGAALWPARRAARVDPLIAIRGE